MLRNPNAPDPSINEVAKGRDPSNVVEEWFHVDYYNDNGTSERLARLLRMAGATITRMDRMSEDKASILRLHADSRGNTYSITMSFDPAGGMKKAIIRCRNTGYRREMEGGNYEIAILHTLLGEGFLRGGLATKILGQVDPVSSLPVDLLGLHSYTKAPVPPTREGGVPEVLTVPVDHLYLTVKALESGTLFQETVRRAGDGRKSTPSVVPIPTPDQDGQRYAVLTSPYEVAAALMLGEIEIRVAVLATKTPVVVESEGKTDDANTDC